jgi:carboxymethylenebutenolidase
MAPAIMRAVPEDSVLRDLHAALEFLKSQEPVDQERIASIGWCIGGGYALDTALQEPTLKAAVINYGHLATDTQRLKTINASLPGLFGGQDRSIPVAEVRKFEQTLKQMGKKIDLVVYPDAGHAFENPNNASGYRANDDADAWKRTRDFLATSLKK